MLPKTVPSRVREPGDGASAGCSAGLIIGGRDQQRGNETGKHQHDAHDEGRGQQQLPRVADAAPDSVRSSVDQRHHGNACLETAQAERQARKDQRRCDGNLRPIAPHLERSFPLRQQGRVWQNLHHPTCKHDEV